MHIINVGSGRAGDEKRRCEREALYTIGMHQAIYKLSHSMCRYLAHNDSGYLALRRRHFSALKVATKLV